MRIKILIFFIYVHVFTIAFSAECNFKCNDGNCIEDDWVCDEEQDCPSGEDEEPGSCLECNSQQFRCSNGRCIPLSYLCDDDNDCSTKEDESPQRCQGSGPISTSNPFAIPTVAIQVTTEMPKVATPDPVTTEEAVEKVTSTVEPTTSTIISAITSTSIGERSFTTTLSVVTSEIPSTTSTPNIDGETTASAVTSDVQSTTTIPLADVIATTTLSGTTSEPQSTTSTPNVDGEDTTAASVVTSELQTATNSPLVDEKATTAASVVTSELQTATNSPLVDEKATTAASVVTSELQTATNTPLVDGKVTTVSAGMTSELQTATNTPLVDGKVTTVSAGMTSDVQTTANILLLNSQHTTTQEVTSRVTELEYVTSNDTGVVTLPNESDKNEQAQEGSSIPSRLNGKEWIVGPIMGVIGPLIIVVSIIIGLLYRSNQKARRIGNLKMQAFEVKSP